MGRSVCRKKDYFQDVVRWAVEHRAQVVDDGRDVFDQGFDVGQIAFSALNDHRAVRPFNRVLPELDARSGVLPSQFGLPVKAHLAHLLLSREDLYPGNASAQFHALDHGAAGIVMGRNIWQSERPIPLIKAVRALIHDDTGMEDAKAILNGE